MKRDKCKTKPACYVTQRTCNEKLCRYLTLMHIVQPLYCTVGALWGASVFTKNFLIITSYHFILLYYTVLYVLEENVHIMFSIL